MLIGFLSKNTTNFHNLQNAFEREGFILKTLESLEDNNLELVHLLIVEHSPPKVDAVSLCKRIKMFEKKDIPVIVLSSENSETLKVLLFELGADDFLTEPFSVLELIARVKVITKRYYKKTKFNHGKISLIPESLEIIIETERIQLTPVEYKILYTLIEKSGKNVSREYIAHKVLGKNSPKNLRSIDVHIRKIRKKLGKYKDYIKTVYGVGYKWLSEEKIQI